MAYVPAVFLRGGTSKGLFFHAHDVPGPGPERDALLLAALGSPDPYGRQLNGMGGGISSLSKAVIVGPATREGAEIDFTFAQVAVDRPTVDWHGNCGNLSSAVGIFAVNEGLIERPDGEAVIRLHNTNTDKIIEARFPVRDSRAVESGDFTIAGVAGTGARIRLDFLDPGGTATRGLLPTGNVVDRLEVEGIGVIEASLVDASNPVVFVRASDLGLSGHEPPEAIEAAEGVMARLDALRRAGAVAMGMAASPAEAGLAVPKVALVAEPAAFRTIDGAAVAPDTYEIAVRMVSMERLHRATPLTGAMCTGVACRIEGTLPNRLARKGAGDEIRIGHPSGVIAVGAEVSHASGWTARSAVVFRTARYLMKGAVAVPQDTAR